MMEPELECDTCGWIGDPAELDEDDCCPDCGSSEIVEYVPDDEVDDD